VTNHACIYEKKSRDPINFVDYWKVNSSTSENICRCSVADCPNRGSYAVGIELVAHFPKPRTNFNNQYYILPMCRGHREGGWRQTNVYTITTGKVLVCCDCFGHKTTTLLEKLSKWLSGM
jgi:hypothetical protein